MGYRIRLCNEPHTPKKIVDGTYMTFNAGDEQLVGVRLRILNEVLGRLLSGNGNEGNTLVGRLEPDDLGAFDRATGLIALVTLAFATLSLLLLLRRSGRGAKETQRAREQLSRHTLYNGDDMAGKLGLDFVGDSARTVSACAVLEVGVRTLRPRTT